MTQEKSKMPPGQILAITLSTTVGGFLSLLLFTWGNLRWSAYGGLAWGVFGLLVGLSIRCPIVDRGMKWGLDRWEHTIHVWAPLLYAINIGMVAVVFFAAAGSFAAEAGLAVFRYPGAAANPALPPFPAERARLGARWLGWRFSQGRGGASRGGAEARKHLPRPEGCGNMIL